MIDLSRCNYTSPTLQTVDTADFQSFSSEFLVRNEDGSMTFIAPSYGQGITHTKNSTYPRSETRETLTNGDDKEANWHFSACPVNILYQDFSIDELPKTGKAIIGQVHGETNNPPYKNNAIVGQTKGTTDIVAVLRRECEGTEDKPVLVSDYKLGTRIQIQAWFFADGTLKVFVNTGDGYKQVINGVLLANGFQYDIDSYKDDTWFAKFGMYSQQVIKEDDPSVGRGVATYWDFGIYHCDVPALLPGEQPPVVVTPEPVPRVLGDLSADVNAALNDYQASAMSSEQALAKIQAIKDEADADFPLTQERKDLYAQITSARKAIRTISSTPPTPIDPVQAQVDGLKKEIAALVTAKATNSMTYTEIALKLNDISTRIKDVPTDELRAPLNQAVRDVKAMP